MPTASAAMSNRSEFRPGQQVVEALAFVADEVFFGDADVVEREDIGVDSVAAEFGDFAAVDAVGFEIEHEEGHAEGFSFRRVRTGWCAREGGCVGRV